MADAFTATADAQDRSMVARYVQMLKRRRWIVLACLAAGIVAGLAVTLTTTRLYRATATVQIDREAARVTNIAGVEPAAQAGGTEFYQTQYGLLKSRALAERVVRKLRLADAVQTETATAPTGAGSDRAARESKFADALIASLTIAPVRGSSLVELSYADADPKQAARIVNAFAATFIEQSLDRRFDATAAARRWLEDKLAETRGKLENSERDVVGYASREGIVTIEQSGANGNAGAPATETSLVATDLGSINSALGQARADRIAAQARYDAARASGHSSSESMADPAIGTLRTRRAELFADYQRQSATFGKDYPTMRALADQIAGIDAQIGAQTASVVGSLRSNYQAAAQREAALQDQVNGLKGQVLDLKRRSIQYNIFRRDADTNRSLYDGLLQRYKEIGIAGGIGATNVSVVDQALPPLRPFTPKPLLNLILGTLAGLLLGVALAMLLEQLDESIAVPADIEGKLHVPLLGSVPRLAEGVLPLDPLRDPKSPITEAYLSVLTALRFSTDHGVPATLLFTSSKPSEGKSTSAIAIAANLGRLGRRVLLIDADLRNPSQHQLLGVTNTVGLSDALAGSDDFAHVRQQVPAFGIDVITTGTLPPNPAELLSSPRLPFVLQHLRGEYDHIIIDGPPVIGLADAPLIANAVEATIFVIAARETLSRAAIVALRRLGDAHAHVIGAILTKLDARTTGYDYAYSYEYGSRTKPQGA